MQTIEFVQSLQCEEQVVPLGDVPTMHCEATFAIMTNMSRSCCLVILRGFIINGLYSLQKVLLSI